MSSSMTSSAFIAAARDCAGVTKRSVDSVVNAINVNTMDAILIALAILDPLGLKSAQPLPKKVVTI
jgi:hypothetical protein